LASRAKVSSCALNFSTIRSASEVPITWREEGRALLISRHLMHSVGTQRSSEVIRGHPRHSESTLRALSHPQRTSAIKSHQEPSRAITRPHAPSRALSAPPLSSRR
jgi:hypothetical protein